MPPKDLNQGPIDERELPVLGPGQTITSVNDQISDAVLKRPYGKGWLLGAAIGFGMVNMLFIAVAWLLFRGVGVWGINRPVMWGFAIINFVWWIGIGHAGTLDLGDPPADEAAVADVDQPVRRGDDPVRRGLRRDVPAAPHGPPLAVLLDGAVPEHDGALAAVPQPAGLGRLRGLDLCLGLADVLVRRPDPRPRHAPRPGPEQARADGLRRRGDGLDRLGPALEAVSDRVPDPGRAVRRRWWSRCIRSCPSTSPSASSPAGTRRSSRPTSSPGPSTPGSRWC